MKIQTVSASIPLLDWRVLRGEGERLPAIDSESLEQGPNAFMKGFGKAGYRSHVRIPWRPSETAFFEAKRGIKISPFLPGTNGATKVLRRVYIGGPQVRFDLALFAPLRPTRLKPIKGKHAPACAARAVDDWWYTSVWLRDGKTWKPLRLWEAARGLAKRFEQETRVRDAPIRQVGSISILPQQIVLVAFLPRADVPPLATLVAEDPSVWLWFDSASQDPDVACIFIEESFEQLADERFSEIRRLRRELIWLHADVQFLLEVGRAVARDESYKTPSLIKAAAEVADGLSQLHQDEAMGLAPYPFEAWRAAKANSLARWRRKVEDKISSRIPIPKWLLGHETHRRVGAERVYSQTVGHRLEVSDNIYPADHVLQLGEISLVEKRLLGDTPLPTRYFKERESVAVTYFASPQSERLRISVVLPVRGGIFPLVVCLESIAEQTLFRKCPEDLELLIIENGPVDPDKPTLLQAEVQAVLAESGLDRSTRRFLLRTNGSNGGRAIARNVGIFKASGEIIMFVDASMVLDRYHLVEHVIRHQRVPNDLALLGFKENLTLPQYNIESFRRSMALIRRSPDPKSDWKWHHKIVGNELDADGLFRFRNKVFVEGDTVNYMQLTGYLRDLGPSEQIGPRSLPTFFQTNIASAPAWRLRKVGGFHSQAFSDNLWGLEDSHLGALLVANGVRLVPCPSAIAFKIEHLEPEDKDFDLDRHRGLYRELLGEPMHLERARKAEEAVRRLEREGSLEEF